MYFKSDLIIKMDQIYISGIEPSLVILAKQNTSQLFLFLFVEISLNSFPHGIITQR